MLEYTSKKNGSVELGSERIPLFFKNNICAYFHEHNRHMSELSHLQNVLNNDNLPRHERRLYAAQYCEKYIVCIEHANYVKGKITDFEGTAETLISDFHPGDEAQYMEEFSEGMDIIKEMVDEWTALHKQYSDTEKNTGLIQC